MQCCCGSEKLLTECCHRVWQQGGDTVSAERVMRARYTAYVQGNIDFLRITTLPIQQSALNIAQITQWSQQTEWLGLQVISHQLATHSEQHAWVVFVVTCRENGRLYTHHEQSAFVRDGASWRFIDPNVSLKTERNQSCFCGSRAKFKRCCAPMLA